MQRIEVRRQGGGAVRVIGFGLLGGLAGAPPGGRNGLAYAINNAGQVVGTADAGEVISRRAAEKAFAGSLA